MIKTHLEKTLSQPLPWHRIPMKYHIDHVHIVKTSMILVFYSSVELEVELRGKNQEPSIAEDSSISWGSLVPQDHLALSNNLIPIPLLPLPSMF